MISFTDVHGETKEPIMQGIRRRYCDPKSSIKDHRVLFSPKQQDLNAKIYAGYTEHK